MPWKKNKSFRVMIGIITFILLVAALRLGKPILLPMIFSVFLSLLLMPDIHVMQRVKIPLGLAAFLSLSMVTVVVFMLADIIQVSIIDFIDKLPSYQKRIDARPAPLWDHLIQWNIIEDDKNEPIKMLASTKTIAGFLGAGMVSFFTLASKLIIVFFITLFLLTESLRFDGFLWLALGVPRHDSGCTDHGFDQGGHKPHERTSTHKHHAGGLKETS